MQVVMDVFLCIPFCDTFKYIWVILLKSILYLGSCMFFNILDKFYLNSSLVNVYIKVHSCKVSWELHVDVPR
jgi:hypothetical protein